MVADQMSSIANLAEIEVKLAAKFVRLFVILAVVSLVVELAVVEVDNMEVEILTVGLMVELAVVGVDNMEVEILTVDLVVDMEAVEVDNMEVVEVDSREVVQEVGNNIVEVDILVDFDSSLEVVCKEVDSVVQKILDRRRLNSLNLCSQNMSSL